MMSYGLQPWQIQDNPESSYAELVLWNAVKTAKFNNVPVQIIDRSGEIQNENNDEYYCTLKQEFKFKKIEYHNFAADTISNGGRILITCGKVNTEEKVDVIFVSVVML